MTKTKIALIAVTSVVTLSIVGIVSFYAGVNSVTGADNEMSEEQYRKDVDKIYEDMADDVIKQSKKTEKAESTMEERIAVTDMWHSIQKGEDKLSEIEHPRKYAKKQLELREKLIEVMYACEEVSKLYEKGQDEKAYDKIQNIIDKFAIAIKAKNKMFGYE